MKKITFFLLSLLMIGFVDAQTSKEEVDLFQAVFGMEKKAVVEAFVQVDDVQKEEFWKLYDEYEIKRKELARKRIELYNQFVANHDKMTNEMATSWTNEVIKISGTTDKLIITYYKKAIKITNPITAMQFYHIENFILTSIRDYILHDIPFVQSKK